MDFYPGSDFEFANLPRESQVIWLAMEGNTDKTIAQLLEITTDTVATYWKRILLRYDSSSRTEVISEFLRDYYEEDLDRLDLTIQTLEAKIKSQNAAAQHQLLATAQLNSLMNLLDVGVLYTNNGLKVNYINEQLCKMARCPLTPKELIGQDIAVFLDNCANRAVKSEDTTPQGFRKLASSSSEKAVDQMTMIDGSILERSFYNVIVRGSTIGHFIVYKDVTSFVAENRVLLQSSKLSEQYMLRTLAHMEAAPDEQSAEIVKSLSGIGKIIGADHAMIGEVDTKRGTFDVIHAWVKNEFDSPPSGDQSIPISFVGWIRKQVSERDYWIIDSVDDLPKSAKMERSIFAESKSRSAIAVSFSGMDPDRKYFVQFSSKKEKRWDRGTVEYLLPLQKIFGLIFSQEVLSEAKSTK